MKTPTIRLDEWLSEIQRLEREARSAGDVAGFTTQDLANMMRTGETVARTRLRDWYRFGLVEFVGWRSGSAMDGRKTKSPVYQLASKARKRRG